MITKDQNVTGAGIICYYDNRNNIIPHFENDILYLTLITHENELDFPKGGIDPGESIKNCATRETYEESNIDVFDFKDISEHYISCGKGLCLFVGELKEEILHNNVIKIKKNNKTKIYEHKGFNFLNYNDTFDKILDFLKIALKEADNIIRYNS